MADKIHDEMVRFERFDTIDLNLGKCSCWKADGGPFAWHPAGCLCPCHGGRANG